MPSAHITFDQTGDKIASRIRKMRPSAVRNLFAAAVRPDIISLSGGMPDVSLLPASAVRKATRAAVEDERAVARELMEGHGDPRDHLGDWEAYAAKVAQTVEAMGGGAMGPAGPAEEPDEIEF